MIRRARLLLFLLIGLAAMPVAAYLLSTATLARQMNSRLGLSQGDSDVLVEYLDPALPEGALRFEGHFWADGPDKVRLDVRWPEGIRTQVRNKDRQMSLEGGARLAALSPMVDLPLEFWTFQSVGPSRTLTAFERFLKSQGVPLDEVSLDRVDQRVCWRIGAANPDAAGAWLDHESFRPVQLRFSRALPNGAARQWITVRFVEWSELGDGAAIPLLIEIDRAERAGWRLRFVQSATAGEWPAPGNALFDLARMEKDHAPQTPAEPGWGARQGMPLEPLTTPSGNGQYPAPEAGHGGN